MMKNLTFIFSGIFLTALLSCNSGKEQYTERTVIDVDTVAAETEYKVKKTIRERTITVDTVTETETFTRETEIPNGTQDDELGVQDQGAVDTQDEEARIQDESVEEQPQSTPQEEGIGAEPEGELAPEQDQDTRSIQDESVEEQPQSTPQEEGIGAEPRR